MQIRPESVREYSAVENIHRIAFGGPGEAAVVARIRQSPHYIAELSLVALEDKRAIGHILFSYVGLQDDRGTVRKVVVLAPLAIHPDFQNRGVGKALIEEGLRQLEVMREPLVLVRGHATYYPKFGFVPSVQLGIKPPFPVSADQYMAKLLSAYGPEYRGTVRYPAAFAEVGYPVQYESLSGSR
jgi:putative acetyltransferase